MNLRGGRNCFCGGILRAMVKGFSKLCKELVFFLLTDIQHFNFNYDQLDLVKFPKIIRHVQKNTKRMNINIYHTK